jgi:hypothetical protein
MQLFKNELRMNNAYIDVCNPIFDALQELNTRHRHINIMKVITHLARKAFVIKTPNKTEDGPITEG